MCVNGNDLSTEREGSRKGVGVRNRDFVKEKGLIFLFAVLSAGLQ